MVEASDDEPGLLQRFRSSVNASKVNSFGTSRAVPILPVTDEKSPGHDAVPASGSTTGGHTGKEETGRAAPEAGEDTSLPLPPPAPPPATQDGSDGTTTAVETESKPSVAIRFYKTIKEILLSSWFNLLLVVVPAGIAAGALQISPIAVFALNAVAIVPLAGLLSHATEVVASSLGDTVGALLNVTFGNAVELIILHVTSCLALMIWLIEAQYVRPRSES